MIKLIGEKVYILSFNITILELGVSDTMKDLMNSWFNNCEIYISS